VNLRKIAYAAAATLALVATSLTVPSVAQATPPSTAPNPYQLSTNVAKAPALPNNYVNANGVTYYTATTMQYGRAIFSVTADSSQAPKLVAHFPAADYTAGHIMNLYVKGNYLFFVDTRAVGQYDMDYFRPYVVNLTTNVVTPITVGDYNLQTSYNMMTGFAAVGDKVYFYSAYGSYLGLFSFNTADGTTAYETDLPTRMSAWSGGMGADRSAENGANLIQAVGNTLYFKTSLDRIAQYDTVSKTWGPLLTYDGSNTVTAARFWGVYNYQGEDGLIFSNSVNGTYWDVRYYFVRPNGTVTPLSNWIDNDVNASGFINFNGKLYYFATPGGWGTAGSVWEISQVDGTRTSINSTLFPGASNVTVSNMEVVDGKLVFIAHTDLNAKDYLFKWSGTGAASQVGTVSGLGNDFFAFPSTANSYPFIQSFGFVGNQVLVGLYKSADIGQAPYRVDLNGNTTLIGNPDQGTEGSYSRLNCSAADASADYLLGTSIVNGSANPVPSLTVASESNGKLKYQTYVLNGVVSDSICGLTKIGDAVYFVGLLSSEGYYNGQAGAVYHLFKLATDGTLTHVGNLDAAWSESAFTDGKYFYYVGASYDPYGDHLYQVDPATGSWTRITGSEASGVQGITTVSNQSASTPPLLVGNKIYFGGLEYGTGDNRPYVATIANDGTVSVALLKNTNVGGNYNFMNSWPRFYNFNGNVVLLTGSTSEMYYQVDQTTDEISLFAEPTPRQRWTEERYPVELNGVIYSIESQWSNYAGIRAVDGTTSTLIDPGFTPDVMFKAGAYIILVDSSNGNVAYFDGTTFTRHDGLFSYNNYTQINYYRLDSPRGTYYSMPEYSDFSSSYQYGPWTNEPVYLGNLIPQATARNGVAVVEAPAKQYPATLPAFDLQAPNAPSSVVASIGASVVNVTWTPANAGSAADGYAVYASPADGSCEVTGTSAVCSGLTTGTKYTFTVKAINSAGLSVASAPSNQVTGPVIGSVPVMVGDVRVGKPVSVTTGTWSAGVTLAYQWKRNGGLIPGATNATYTPVSADYGSKLTVSVIGKKYGYAWVTMTSSATVIKSNVVTFTGSAKQGQTLTADAGIWDDGTVITYQWQRDNADIAGATNAKYVVAGEDAGSKLSVAVTGTKGSSLTLSSAKSATVPFKNFSKMSKATIDTIVHPFESICAYSGVWDSKANLSYQWYRNGVAIDGATDSCYWNLQVADVGAFYSAVVTGSRPGYITQSSRSVATKIILNSFGQLDKPQLYGDSTVDSNLTVDLGNVWWQAWFADVEYQWLRNGAVIPGATADNYTITNADKRKRIVVRVTVSYPGYKTQVLVSTTTDLIVR